MPDREKLRSFSLSNAIKAPFQIKFISTDFI